MKADTTTRVRGRRLPDTQPYRTTISPGDYLFDPKTGRWWVRPPTGQTMNLDDYVVHEHDDGTISVEPAIKAVGMTRPGWVGTLTKGVWLT